MYYKFIFKLFINYFSLKIRRDLDPNTPLLNLKQKVEKYGSTHKLIAATRLLLNDIDNGEKK